MSTSNGESIASGCIRRILVLGDNRIAESIVHGLSYGRLEVHQSTHTKSSLESHHGVTIHKVQTSQESLTALFHAVRPDLVFSTQAAGSFGAQKQYIDTAITSQTPRFVLAEFAQDTLNERIQARLPPYRERAKTLDYIREKSSRGEISFTGIATGCLLDHALSSGNLGFDLKWQSASIHGSGTEKFAASSSAWIGRVALAVVQHWEDVQNMYLYAAGMVISAQQILECLQNATGKSWETGPFRGLGELTSEAERRFKMGFPDAGMFLMERSVLFDEVVDAVRPFVEKDAKSLLGLEAEKLEDVVQKAAQDFERGSKGADCGCD